MKKRKTTRVLLSLLLVALFVGLGAGLLPGVAGALQSPACDWVVGPNDIPTISAAVAAASSGQTICVHGGIYHERVEVPAAKSNLALLAISGETPIIDGQKVLPGGAVGDRFKGLMEIKAAGVTVDGFEIRFSSARGLDVAADNVTVRNTAVHNNWSTGINVTAGDTLNDVLIENNQVYSNMRRSQYAPVIYRGLRTGSSSTDWAFDPHENWDTPFWTGADADLPEQWLNGVSMTFNDDGRTERVYAGSARAGRNGYIGPEYSATGQEFSYSGADILFHEPANNKWTLYFDGEPRGIPQEEVIDAFQIESTAPISVPWPCPTCAPILLSFLEPVTLPIDDGAGGNTPTAIATSDLVYFRPTAIVNNRVTDGVFTIHKRAADLVGLPAAANIDALDRAPDGRLLISLTDTQTLTNPDLTTITAEREDLVAYDEVTGVWSLFFEGDQILFNPFQAEDLTAAWVDDDGHIYISGDPIGGSALTLIDTTNSTARGNHVYNNFGEGLVADRYSVGATLEGNVLYDNQHANLYLNSTTDTLIKGNLVFCSDDRRFWRKGSSRSYKPGPGIQIRDEAWGGTNPPPLSSGYVIINNIVYGCSTNFGVSSQKEGGGLNDSLVANNVFAHAHGDGSPSGYDNVNFNSDASFNGSSFVNNLLLQSAALGVNTRIQGWIPANFATFTLANNLYSITPAERWENLGEEPGRIIADPQLADPQLSTDNPPLPVMGSLPDADDFRLTYDSPAVDAGQPLAEVVVDYFNQPRANAGPPDLGIHELPHIGGIDIVQETSPGAYVQAFNFSASHVPGGFTLEGGQTYSSGVLPAGVYSVTSAQVDGWTTTATCDDGSSPDAIHLGPAETVICTFHSARQTRLIVINQVEPASDPQQFTFNLSPGESFDMAQDSRTFLVAPDVPHALSVSVPAGWQQTAASCDNGDAPGAVTLEAGRWVTCTFAHRKLGQVIVEKQTLPDGAAQTFDFTAAYGTFALGDGQRHTSEYLAPGVYGVAETLPAGWIQMSATCDDGSAPDAVNLGPGETVTCVFTNANLSLSLGLTPTPGHVTAPGGDVVFDVQVDNTGGVAVELTALTDSDFGDVADPGNAALLSTTCDLPQTLAAGAGYACAFTAHVNGAAGSIHSNTLTAAALGPGNAPLNAADEAEVTIGSPAAGRIIVIKQTNPPNTPGSFGFTTSYASGGFNLSHGQSHDSGPLPSEAVYSVAENAAAGWELTSATCDDGSPPGAIDLSPAETVTCTFVNAPVVVQQPTILYVTTPNAGNVRGLAYSPGDILAYNRQSDTWSVYFDASDVGLNKPLADFVLLEDNSILMAFGSSVKLRNAANALVTYATQDVARFVPSSLGTATSGHFIVYFDGSDVTLSTSSEKIDALDRRADGVLLISTSGAAAVKNGGVTLKAQDEDLLAFAPQTLGASTTGTWSIAFDGTAVAGMGVENVSTVWHDAATGDLYLTVTSNFTIGGVSGTNRSVLRVTPARAVSLYWNASDAGYNVPVSGLHIQK